MSNIQPIREPNKTKKKGNTALRSDRGKGWTLLCHWLHPSVNWRHRYTSPLHTFTIKLKQEQDRHSSVCNGDGGEMNHSDEGFSHTKIGHKIFFNKVLDWPHRWSNGLMTQRATALLRLKGILCRNLLLVKNINLAPLWLNSTISAPLVRTLQATIEGR